MMLYKDQPVCFTSLPDTVSIELYQHEQVWTTANYK